MSAHPPHPFRAAIPAACLAAVLAWGCAGRAGAPPGSAATSWTTPIPAQGAEPFVSGGPTKRVWLGVISHEMPYDQAKAYCRRLPTHRGSPWRVPDMGELLTAPFDQYLLPEEPVRLWTATPEPGELYRRWVVDPRTRAPEIKDVRQGIHLRVLCVCKPIL
jgi:hypothetical protein